MQNSDKSQTKDEGKDDLPKEFLNNTENRPPKSQITDRFGNTFAFGNAGDVWIPPFPVGEDTYRIHIRNIRNLKIRPDDVLICSYPKTGLHMTQVMVHMLMNKSTQHVSDIELVAGFLDYNPTSKVDQVPSPRLLTTHVPYRHIPKQAIEKKIKIILLDRNPKDTLVSYYNHMNNRIGPISYHGTFEHFFYLNMEVGFVYGNMFDYVLEWQAALEANPQLDVCQSVFEDAKQDIVGSVKKLNKYLNTGCSDQLCEDIAAACSFSKMKEAKEALNPEYMKAAFKPNTSFYRKGDVGDWKNWFTVAMNEQFDKTFAYEMTQYKRKYKYTLP